MRFHKLFKIDYLKEAKNNLKFLTIFHTFFEEGGWAKHNQKNINDLEKKYIKIKKFIRL